jgi:hypothetical protein
MVLSTSKNAATWPVGVGVAVSVEAGSGVVGNTGGVSVWGATAEAGDGSGSVGWFDMALPVSPPRSNVASPLLLSPGEWNFETARKFFFTRGPLCRIGPRRRRPAH